MSRPEQFAVRGIVTGIDWDERGNVTRVALMTRDEQEFELEALGEEATRLPELQRREVVALGSLGTSRDGRRLLRVTMLAVIE